MWCLPQPLSPQHQVHNRFWLVIISILAFDWPAVTRISPSTMLTTPWWALCLNRSRRGRRCRTITTPLPSTCHDRSGETGWSSTSCSSVSAMLVAETPHWSLTCQKPQSGALAFQHSIQFYNSYPLGFFATVVETSSLRLTPNVLNVEQWQILTNNVNWYQRLLMISRFAFMHSKQNQTLTP